MSKSIVNWNEAPWFLDGESIPSYQRKINIPTPIWNSETKDMNIINNAISLVIYKKIPKSQDKKIIKDFYKSMGLDNKTIKLLFNHIKKGEIK